MVLSSYFLKTKAIFTLLKPVETFETEELTNMLTQKIVIYLKKKIKRCPEKKKKAWLEKSESEQAQLASYSFSAWLKLRRSSLANGQPPLMEHQM